MNITKTTPCVECGAQMTEVHLPVLGISREFCGACAERREQEYQAKLMADNVMMAMRDVATQRELLKLQAVDPKLPEAFEAIIDGYYDPLAPKWALLHGVTGVGKTTLLHAFAWRLAQKYYEHPPQMMYVPEVEIMAELKRFEMTYKYYSEVGVLLIDELGLSTGTDFEWRQWSAIIDDRYRHGRITIMATNLTLEDMEEHPMFGARTMRRINDMASEQGIIEVKGVHHEQ